MRVENIEHLKNFYRSDRGLRMVDQENSHQLKLGAGVISSGSGEDDPYLGYEEDKGCPKPKHQKDTQKFLAWNILCKVFLFILGVSEKDLRQESNSEISMPEKKVDDYLNFES